MIILISIFISILFSASIIHILLVNNDVIHLMKTFAVYFYLITIINVENN
jgi:hypothetical protein